jgi:hypothetical protein
MSQKRKKYTQAQNVALVTQVARVCPLCAEPLFYKKNGISFKQYEIAHIYPLNPTQDEIDLLANEERLSEDVNNENNVIPLCDVCHGKFDKPRTVEEYRKLFHIKKELIQRSDQEGIWKRHTIESEISTIIEAIYDDPDLEVSVDLNFSPKKVDEKLDSTMSRPTHRKIKNYVQDYYMFIKDKFATLDQSEINLSEVISLQVKTYYILQMKEGRSQQVVFENIVSWINAKTQPKTYEAAEILASFFIQNCEVFE